MGRTRSTEVAVVDSGLSLYDPVLDDADYILGRRADTRIGGGALLLEQGM